MNIYIKDMDMPSDCMECKMSYEGNYCLLVEDDNEAILDGKMWRRCPLSKRPDWCPLFEDIAITTLPKNPQIRLDFSTCMNYLTSNDLEARAIEHLFAVFKSKSEATDRELGEKKAVIRAAYKINQARIKDEAIRALLEE